MCGGWLIGSSVTKAQGWGGWLSLYFVRAAELACFHDFCRHLLTNPVRDISGFVSRMAFCDAGPVNRVSPADLWVNFRRSALDIWANLREGGRSIGRGLAVKDCFSKQPRDSSNSGGVTRGCVSKAQSRGGGDKLRLWLKLEYVTCLSETLQSRVPWQIFPGLG